jgi:DNA-binding NarL/FixJ family response regulator
MAGKTRPMSQIKQMIRLHQQGYAIKAIARSLSISKNTVKTYLYKIGEAKLNMSDLLAVEDPVLEGLPHCCRKQNVQLQVYR